MTKKLPSRTWHVYRVNCDCSAYKTTRFRRTRPGAFFRCDFCRRQLGDMQVDFLGTVAARTDSEAVDKINQQRSAGELIGEFSQYEGRELSWHLDRLDVQNLFRLFAHAKLKLKESARRAISRRCVR